MVPERKIADYYADTAAVKTDQVNILLIEDSETDAYSIERMIVANMPCACRVWHVGTVTEGETILSHCDDVHVVLLDLGLPDSTGPEDAYGRMEAYKDKTPIVVLTNFEDDHLAIQMLGGGVQDYVHKSSISTRPDMLCRNIQFAIGRHHSSVEARRKMAHELEEKDNLLNLVTGGYSVMH
jgi:DNA-binding NarL/FixJ family response regulator